MNAGSPGPPNPKVKPGYSMQKIAWGYDLWEALHFHVIHRSPRQSISKLSTLRGDPRQSWYGWFVPVKLGCRERAVASQLPAIINLP